MQRSTEKNFFSVPKFIRMPSVGIDISDCNIKFAELVPHSDGMHLGRFGEIPIPAGIVEGGRIVAPDKLLEFLIKLRREQNLSFVRVTLPEEQVYFFRTSLPSASHDTLRSTLELSLEDHVPISPQEAVFDFDIVGKTNENIELAVTVSHRSVVEVYTEVFAKAGLTLLSLELEAEALAHAVTNVEDSTTHLIVDFGAVRTGIVVARAGQVYFTSTVNIGGQMLTDTLAKHFGIATEEAEKIKREFGLLRNVSNQDLFSLLLNNIAVLRDEIEKHFIFWHTHPDENGKPRPTIEEVVLVGGDANLAGLAGYLSASLHVKVSIGNVWTNIALPKTGVPDLSRSASLSYAAVIGLSLGDGE